MTNRSCEQAAEMRVFQVMKRVTHWDKMLNENTQQEMDMKSFLIVIQEAELKGYGHVWHME